MNKESELELRRNDLKKLLSEEIYDAQICQKCKMCLRVCPTYTGWYTEGPIGRTTAIYYHYNYGIGSKKELSEILFNCTACKKCQILCEKMAMGVKTTDIIIKARQLLVEEIEIEELESNVK